MTTQTQCTRFDHSCQVSESNNCIHIVYSGEMIVEINSSQQELDQIVDVCAYIGQCVKQETAVKTLEFADKRATSVAKQIDPSLHLHGQRPFTIKTHFGDIQIQRNRLFQPKTGKTIISSALLWQTKQNRHMVSALSESSCHLSQYLSFRKAKKQLATEARQEDLLAHSTVWNLKQKEGLRLENAQDQFIEKGLNAHGEFLQEKGFLPLPAPAKIADGQMVEEEFPPVVRQESDDMYNYFASDLMVAPHNPKRQCHVPDDVILLQADEVVTKSQEVGRKTNKTFTATVETGSGRCDYFVSRTGEKLQQTVAIALRLTELFPEKRLEVISDGASWIGTWIEKLRGVDVYHLLCWYHLYKRVYAGLSGLGFSPVERDQVQKEVLGVLWHGRVTVAVQKLKELLPRCRCIKRVEELINYLIRKQCCIGDYATRHEQGLWIASTRVEKWNDLAVSDRCKRRGMSWTESGVLAIALHATKQKMETAQNIHIVKKNPTTL